MEEADLQYSTKAEQADLLQKVLAATDADAEVSKQPIRTRYLGHVTGYQPIRDQCFLIRVLLQKCQCDSGLGLMSQLLISWIGLI